MVAHSTTRALCVIKAVSGFFRFDRRLRDGVGRSRICKLRWVFESERIGHRRCHPLLAAVAVLAKLAGHCEKRTKLANARWHFGPFYVPVAEFNLFGDGRMGGNVISICNISHRSLAGLNP
jgi:hypothetical protein